MLFYCTKLVRNIFMRGNFLKNGCLVKYFHHDLFRSDQFWEHRFWVPTFNQRAFKIDNKNVFKSYILLVIKVFSQLPYFL